MSRRYNQKHSSYLASGEGFHPYDHGWRLSRQMGGRDASTAAHSSERQRRRALAHWSSRQARRRRHRDYRARVVADRQAESGLRLRGGAPSRAVLEKALQGYAVRVSTDRRASPVHLDVYKDRYRRYYFFDWGDDRDDDDDDQDDDDQEEDEDDYWRQELREARTERQALDALDDIPCWILLVEAQPTHEANDLGVDELDRFEAPRERESLMLTSVSTTRSAFSRRRQSRQALRQELSVDPPAYEGVGGADYARRRRATTRPDVLSATFPDDVLDGRIPRGEFRVLINSTQRHRQSTTFNARISALTLPTRFKSRFETYGPDRRRPSSWRRRRLLDVPPSTAVGPRPEPPVLEAKASTVPSAAVRPTPTLKAEHLEALKLRL